MLCLEGVSLICIATVELCKNCTGAVEILSGVGVGAKWALKRLLSFSRVLQVCVVIQYCLILH